jgi:hypothetical protein
MRNRDDIRRRMHEQAYITSEQQDRWFSSINNQNNYFFLIFSEDSPVGVVQAKNVDYLSRTGEGGIYIWDARARSAGVGAKASLCLLDIAFLLVSMNTITAKVRTDNPVAQRHNLSFGYRFSNDACSEYMSLSRENFLSKGPRLRALCSNGQDLQPTSINDMEFPEASTDLELYKNLPDDVREVFALKISGLR